MSRRLYECARCLRLVGRVVVVSGIEKREKGEAWEPFACCALCVSEMRAQPAARKPEQVALDFGGTQ